MITLWRMLDHGNRKKSPMASINPRRVSYNRGKRKRIKRTISKKEQSSMLDKSVHKLDTD